MKKIYAVCITAQAGNKYDKDLINKHNIKVGDKFLLTNARVGNWSTNVYLEGFKESFNSVFFNYFDDDGNPYDIYSDKNFYTYSSLGGTI